MVCGAIDNARKARRGLPPTARQQCLRFHRSFHEPLLRSRFTGDCDNTRIAFSCVGLRVRGSASAEGRACGLPRPPVHGTRSSTALGIEVRGAGCRSKLGGVLRCKAAWHARGWRRIECPQEVGRCDLCPWVSVVPRAMRRGDSSGRRRLGIELEPIGHDDSHQNIN